MSFSTRLAFSISNAALSDEGGHSYELVDTNFDGKVDERWEYDEQDIMIGLRMDQNRNGIFETELVMVHGSFFYELVDSDENGLNDIYSKFDHGIALCSEKYYSVDFTEGGTKIGRINYKFDYPDGPEIFTKTDLTEKQFASSRVK